MKAKQNVEKIEDFETLIISSPNCNDIMVMSLINRTHFRIYRNTTKAKAIEQAKLLPYYTTLERELVFENKVYIVTNSEEDEKSTIFCIEEDGDSLKINQLKRKTEQNKDLFI